MLNKHYLNKIIFLSIETVPQSARFEDLSVPKKHLFLKRFRSDFGEYKQIHSDASDEAVIELLYSDKASLHPEWGKICCISFLVLDEDGQSYKSASISDKDEKVLLQKFLDTCVSVRDYATAPPANRKAVCSYSGFGFTWPFMAKRFLLNMMPLPAMFDYTEGKPWEQTQFIDLMQLWSYGTKGSYTSLDTLAEGFGVEYCDNPTHISGWYNTGDLKSLKEYGESRTLTLAHCYLRIKGIATKLVKK